MHWDTEKIVHPLFGYTIAFALGILAKFFQLNSLLIMLALALLLSLALFFKKQKNLNQIKSPLLILFFSLGFLRFYFCEKQNQKIIELLKTKTDYSAQVLDISSYTAPFFKYKILLRLTSHADQSVKFNINVYMPNIYEMRISDRLEVKGLTANYQKSNQGSLYSNESTMPKLFTSKLLFSIAHRPKFSFLRLAKEAKYNLAKNICAKMSQTTGTLFEYIFLGLKNSSSTSDQLRCKFNYWGIAHYLARSGLHVVMIIFLWSLLLSFMPVGFVFKQLILIVLAIIYSLLSWPSTSFARALITFLLVQSCLVIKIPVRSSYLITLCSLLFLIINPLQLFFLDFQLSFGLALGISLFNEIYNKNR